MTDNTIDAGTPFRTVTSGFGRADGAGLSRRRLIGGAALLAGGLLASTSATAFAARPTGPRLTLPPATGPYDIGGVSLHLTDPTRPDPWQPRRPRELMVTLWYPAEAGRTRHFPWLAAGELAHYRAGTAGRLTEAARSLGLGDVDISLDGVEFPITDARQCPPVLRCAGAWPVVLYSPSAGAGRQIGTTLVQDLASQGYIVVTISHTYDAGEVEFPGGRVEVAGADLDDDGHTLVAVRRADTRFVLDRLAALNTGVEHLPLPSGLAGRLDLARIGMFGHSFGGATTGQTMAVDQRVIAGLDLDGHVIPDVAFGAGSGVTPDRLTALVGDIADRIGDRPFMVMSSAGAGPEQGGPLMTGFWNRLRGWRRYFSIVGSTHGTYTDEKVLIHQLAAAGVIPAGLTVTVGAIAPDRATVVERAYVTAFFQRWLCDGDGSLLDGTSDRYPEVLHFPSA